MEENEEMENDAPDVYDALDATATAIEESNETEALRQSMGIVRQLEVELERNRSPNVGVLKASSGNVPKRLKGRQETRVATWSSKNAEATIKQIAIQELQAEKLRIQEWKRNVMAEVAHELQAIKATQVEAIEA